MPSTFNHPKARRTVACVLILLAGAAMLSVACRRTDAPDSPSTGLDGESIRVVTWNVQKCERGFDGIVRELGRLDADVVFLQEVIEPRGISDAQDQTRDLAEALGMHAYSYGGPLDERRQQCLAILSRAPLRETAALATSTERNYAVAALTHWKGQPLRLVCVHLAGTYKINPRHIIETSRERGRDWAALQQEASAWSETVILAGDFNMPGAAAQLRRLNRRLRLVSPTSHTFPSQSPLLDLDHVLCSVELYASPVENIDSRASDHRPLLVAFSRQSE